MASAALASLASLVQTTDQILNHHQSALVLPKLTRQLRHLLDQIVLVHSFLQDHPEEAGDLSERTTSVANDAIESIQSQMNSTAESVTHCGCGIFTKLKHQCKCQMLFTRLRKVTKEIDAIVEQVRKIKDSFKGKAVQVSDSSPATSISTSSPYPNTNEDAMVSSTGEPMLRESAWTSQVPFDADKDLTVGFEDAILKGKAVQVSDSFPSTSISTSSLHPHTNEDVMVSSTGDPIPRKSSRISQDPSDADKDPPVGFEKDVMAIKTRLGENSCNLQVIPIVGMGGIGKTTLAKNAYYDLFTVDHFQVRAWVTVTQDYVKQNMFSSLLKDIKLSIESSSQRSIDSTADLVYKSLKGRKYLIVMDDMWSLEVWDDVRRFFPDDHNGSRIILTTRWLDVAKHAASMASSPHEMHFMDDEGSWKLLRQRVFGDENCPSELESVGKRIAGSCEGLPLAIVVIAGLLSTVSKTQHSWEEIARDVNLILTEDVEQFAKKVLTLSYKHLPPHLSPCFLYMGLFPGDYEIYSWKLFKLWEAEGFLEPSRSKSCEEQAEEYLDDLVKRSLVLVIKRKTNGKVKSCGIHDLVQELCRRQAEEEKFLLHVRPAHHEVLPETIKDEHRVSIARSYLNWPGNSAGSIIHTFICFQCNVKSEFFLGYTRLLQVLDVVNGSAGNCLWRDDLFELFHLRCLAVDYAVDIPPSISKFHNLQTIIIHRGKTFKSYSPYFITYAVASLEYVSTEASCVIRFWSLTLSRR